MIPQPTDPVDLAAWLQASRVDRVLTAIIVEDWLRAIRDDLSQCQRFHIALFDHADPHHIALQQTAILA